MLEVKTMTGLNSLNWTPLADSRLEVGDLVSADAGGMPIYRVVAIEAEGRAWLKGEQAPEPRVMPLALFCWKAADRG